MVFELYSHIYLQSLLGRLVGIVDGDIKNDTLLFWVCERVVKD